MHRKIVVRLFSALVLLTLALVTAPAYMPTTSAAGPNKLHIFHTKDWYLQRRAARATNNIPASPTDNLPPGSGPVMYTTQAFAIYWTPNNTIGATFKNLLQRYFTDLGGTPFLNIVTQYYDTVSGSIKYIQNVETYGGAWTDTGNAYPHAGTTADPLGDGDIQAEVDRAITANSWPTGLGNMFFVFTEKGIESCTSFGCTPGAAAATKVSGYCAYHSNFNSGSNERIYANMPYVATWSGSCNNTNGQPNNFDADLEISTTSHEEFEAITDPEPNNNWTDGNCAGGVVCGEIGDKCAYLFTGVPTNTDNSNMTLHGNPYNTQPEWSNAITGCSMDYKPASVSIVKSGPGTVTAGASLLYSINVTSSGEPTAETPKFSDVLAASLKFQSITAPGGWSCLTPPVGSTGTVNCSKSNGFLNKGESASFAISAQVAASTANGSTLNNTGRIDWDTKYPNKLNNTSSTAATVVTSADLNVSKTTAGTAVAGSDLSFIIDAENDGPSDAQSVNLTDAVPAGTTFVSFTGSGGWTCSLPAVGGTGTVLCSKSTMPSGEVDALTLTVHVPANAANGSSVSNTVNISSGTPDPNTSNNTSTVSAKVGTSADVSVTKTNPTTVVAGNNFNYTITVKNTGPSDAQNVAWTDTLPAGTTFVSVSPSAGCSGTATVTCSITTLAAGGSATFTLAVKLNPGAANGSQLCNTVTVTSATADPNPTNNSSTSCATVTTSADLALLQTGSKTGVPGNGTATFQLTITNNGPSNSQYVVLATTVNLTNFPPSLRGAPVTATADGGGTCTVTGQNVTCKWNVLAVTSSVHATVTAAWISGVSQVCDAANVSAGTPDPIPGNNSSNVCVNKK